jgi:hypothetical protein
LIIGLPKDSFRNIQNVIPHTLEKDAMLPDIDFRKNGWMQN